MTDLALVKAEVVTEESETAKGLAYLRSMAVANQGDYDFAADLVKEAKKRWKALDERRKSLTDPLNATIKGINDLFRPTLSALKDAETVLKAKMASFVDSREAERRAVMLASATEYAAGGIPCTPIPEVATAPGVSTREAWTCEVVDESQIPREYLAPDFAKLRAAAPGPVPGVRYTRETRLTVRT